MEDVVIAKNLNIQPSDVYKRIKYLLMLKEKSLYQLADYVGVSRTSTGNWNKFFPQMPIFFRICDFLGCSMEYLYTGSNDVTEDSVNATKVMSNFNKMAYEDQVTVNNLIKSLAEKNCSQNCSQ